MIINGTTKTGEACTTLFNTLITLGVYLMIFEDLNIEYNYKDNTG